MDTVLPRTTGLTAHKKKMITSPLARSVLVHVRAPSGQTGPQEFRFWLVELGQHVPVQEHGRPHRRVRQRQLCAR